MHTILSQEQYHFEIYLKSMQKLMKQVGPKRKQERKKQCSLLGTQDDGVMKTPWIHS
jgi:hypothetical protein